MARPGPKPQPTRIKELKGGRSTYHRGMPKNEPEPEKAKRCPPAPAHLSDPAKKEWKRIAAELYRLGLLTTVDRTGLEAYCMAYAQWLEATEKIKKHGMVIKAPSGFPVQNPFLAIANRAASEMRTWLCEFGMTPSSRTRVKATPIDKQDGDPKNPIDAWQRKIRQVK